MEDGKPNYSLVAKALKNKFELDCSSDWLRNVVKTKWEQWSGKGAMRRAMQEPKDQNVVDPEVCMINCSILTPFHSKVVAIMETQSQAEDLAKVEATWQDNVIDLFRHRVPPPILDLGETSLRPADIQENFRLKMMAYWASHPSALRYSLSVDPANLGTAFESACNCFPLFYSLGALEVLRYYKGHRDSKGSAVPGEGSILDDIAEIHRERAERKEAAKKAVLPVEKGKQRSILAFLKPRYISHAFENRKPRWLCFLVMATCNVTCQRIHKKLPGKRSKFQPRHQCQKPTG